MREERGIFRLMHWSLTQAPLWWEVEHVFCGWRCYTICIRCWLRVNWSMFLDGGGIQYAVIAGQCTVTGTHRHRCEPFLPVITVGAEKQNMMKLWKKSKSKQTAHTVDGASTSLLWSKSRLLSHWLDFPLRPPSIRHLKWIFPTSTSMQLHTLQ